MALPYNQSAFDTAKCVEAWIEYPFLEQGDTSTKVYHHKMNVNRSTYTPLAFNDVMTAAGDKPTGSPFSDDANAYWVKDTVPSDISGGVFEFERIFANIPTTRIEGNGIYAFTYPGVDSAVTSTLATSTANESATFDAATNEGIMAFDVDPGDVSKFSVGQRLHINNNNQGAGLFEVDVPSFGWSLIEMNNAFVTDITSNTITTREDLSAYSPLGFRSGVAITTFTAVSTIPARDPFTRNATSRMNYSYVKSDDLIDISIAAKFEPTTSAGVPTDTLTTTTIPTKATYLGFVQNGTFLAAESTKVSRWMGNIWQKESITVQSL